MNAKKLYLHLLDKELQLSLSNLFPDSGAVFQDDNASYHRAKVVKSWFTQRNLDRIDDWPGQGPDLNVLDKEL